MLRTDEKLNPEQLLLTKYSKSNTPSSRIVSINGRFISWRHEPRDGKWIIRTPKTFEMTEIRPCMPGSVSKHWFDVATAPPALSFIIFTKTRTLYFTAPSIEVFVACVNRIEIALGGISESMKSSDKVQKRSPSSTMKEATYQLDSFLANGYETETYCYSLPTANPLDFIDNYDEALRSIGSNIQFGNWELSTNKKSFTRNVESRHTPSSRFFTREVTVQKSMILFCDQENKEEKGDFNDVSRLILLEMNTFSGASLIDLFVILIKWDVYVNPLMKGNAVVIQVESAICFRKDSMFKFPVISEFKKHARVTSDAFMELVTAACNQQTSHDTSDQFDTLLRPQQGLTNIMADMVSASTTPVLQFLNPTSALLLGELSRAFLSDAKKTSKTNLAPDINNKSATEIEQPKIEGFICPSCGQITNSQGALMVHFTVFHTDEDTSTNRGSDLSALLSSDNAAAGFVCPECFLQFENGAELANHFDDIHDGIAPAKVNDDTNLAGFVCPECFLQFENGEMLMDHFASAHTKSDRLLNNWSRSLLSNSSKSFTTGDADRVLDMLNSAFSMIESAVTVDK